LIAASVDGSGDIPAKHLKAKGWAKHSVWAGTDPHGGAVIEPAVSRLWHTTAAMAGLAKAFEPEQLAREAFRLYEEFRPRIPEGLSGWGAKGEFDLNRVRALKREK